LIPVKQKKRKEKKKPAFTILGNDVEKPIIPQVQRPAVQQKPVVQPPFALRLPLPQPAPQPRDPVVIVDNRWNRGKRPAVVSPPAPAAPPQVSVQIPQVNRMHQPMSALNRNFVPVASAQPQLPPKLQKPVQIPAQKLVQPQNPAPVIPVAHPTSQKRGMTMTKRRFS
jgi:hypothetical protein